MIDFEHVSKTYETHNDENVALEDINIHIDEVPLKPTVLFCLAHIEA